MKKDKKNNLQKAGKIAKGAFIGFRILWTILGIVAGCIFIGTLIYCAKTIGLELKGCLGL